MLRALTNSYAEKLKKEHGIKSLDEVIETGTVLPPFDDSLDYMREGLKQKQKMYLFFLNDYVITGKAREFRAQKVGSALNIKGKPLSYLYQFRDAGLVKVRTETLPCKEKGKTKKEVSFRLNVQPYISGFDGLKHDEQEAFREVVNAPAITPSELPKRLRFTNARTNRIWHRLQSKGLTYRMNAKGKNFFALFMPSALPLYRKVKHDEVTVDFEKVYEVKKD
jgi:hypothetical protein